MIDDAGLFAQPLEGCSIASTDGSVELPLALSSAALSGSAADISELEPAAWRSRPLVLHLFSGPKERPDGLAAFLESLGVHTCELDTQDECVWIGQQDDLTDDDVFQSLLLRCQAGEFAAVVAGIPCSTFSVARFALGGAPPVRWKPDAIRGGDVPGHEAEIAASNTLVDRAVQIIRAVVNRSGCYIVENPIDRSNAEQSERLHLGHWPRHASLWDMEEMKALRQDTASELIHFPQCALGGDAQKWTTLLVSSSLADHGLRAELGSLRCTHARGTHRKRGRGRGRDGAYTTSGLAAYPPQMNRILAHVIASVLVSKTVAIVVEQQPGDWQAADRQAGWRIGDSCWYTGAEGVRRCTVVSVFDDGDVPFYAVDFGDGSVVRDTEASRLQRVAAPLTGSKRPHASLGAAPDAAPVQKAAASASLRRNEPELPEALFMEQLPAVNMPPRTDWFDPPIDERRVPEPLTTDQLIPQRVQRKLREHLHLCQEAYRRARTAKGWHCARHVRPEPLQFTEEEALLPAGRGWQWRQGSDGFWHPLTASRWPDDPPESDLKVSALLRLAQADPKRFGAEDVAFPDKFELACMAHGFPAPELEPAAVIGYPHMGALKNMTALDKMILKDRRQENAPGAQAWTVHGGSLPQVWPMRADPINIVIRHGKARMTIDKSMRLAAHFLSYNEAVDLSSYDPVELVRVEQLCRAVAILLTAHADVRVWSFDLDAYFRRSGKQRSDWWKSGYVLPDGYAFDKRLQFGQREAPVLTSRQTNFIVWVVRRELHAFDCSHPSVEPSVRAWQLLRGEFGGASPAPSCPWTSLHFLMAYVDDAGGASVDDLLYARGGGAVFGAWDATAGCFQFCDAGAVGAVHLRRPDAHYSIALRAVTWIGHLPAEGKGVPPGFSMDLLGVHIDILADQRRLTQLKCDMYSTAVRAALAAPAQVGGGQRVPYQDFNSMVHKLLHASATVVLGRQHVHHLMQALRAKNRLAQQSVLIFEPQRDELRWWLEQFGDPTRHCLPLASRIVFPYADLDHTMASYSDAARELNRPDVSGFGAWTVMGDVLYFIAGLWKPWELSAFSINVLELAAENIGTFTFLAQAVQLGREVTHSVDFVDNTAAEYSADRGKPAQADMRALVRRRYDALDAACVYSAVERITSADNEWADALSRGADRVADVRRMALAAGLHVVELQPVPEWRDLSGLPGAPPADARAVLERQNQSSASCATTEATRRK